jgi:hypothetical protein
MVEPVLQLVHVLAGAVALILGPIALQAPKRIGRHSRIGLAFFAAVCIVSISGGVLSLMHWNERWPFFWIAAGTGASALLGYGAARLRFRHWLVVHVGAQGSAYTAMVTAFIVANWDEMTGVEGTGEPLAFLVPMAIGSLAVGWLMWEVRRGRRPRRAATADQPGLRRPS